VRNALLVVLFVTTALSASAKEAALVADDAALAAGERRIAEELRCLVCQNQTIADSQADLAVDLRKQIREKLRQGLSERQIRDFMVERYGDFVLYRPPLKATTLVLWAGPFVLLAAGGLVLARYVRSRRRAIQSAEMSAADVRRARQLLEGSAEP
jgi:cytochrome c-type biogenesis protein CcmH